MDPQDLCLFVFLEKVLLLDAVKLATHFYNVRGTFCEFYRYKNVNFIVGRAWKMFGCNVRAKALRYRYDGVLGRLPDHRSNVCTNSSDYPALLELNPPVDAGQLVPRVLFSSALAQPTN